MYKKVLMAVLLLATMLYTTACGEDTSMKATTMHLKHTEGTVAVSDGAKKDVPLLENLSLYSGYEVDTHSESYAWINLDDVKLTKMDQESEIAIQKEGKALEIEIISGSLFFNVTQPLEDDETMDIRTSTMLVGIWGTCGWMEYRDGISRVYVLEGTVECSAGGQTVQVNAGEMAELMANGKLVVQTFIAQDILVFVLDELIQDTDLCGDIYEASGLDVLETAGGEGDSRFAEETEDSVEEVSYSFIFSDMPIAAYEVTGLGVGRFESVYDEHIIDEDGYDNGIIPFIRLTPEENTFVIFCIPEDDSEDNISLSAIHSPPGSSQWKAISYTCLDGYYPIPDGFSYLTRQDADSYYGYSEETYGGGIDSVLDPWLDWIRFAGIYHPDAQQDDTIYAIEFNLYPGDEDGEIDEMRAGIVKAFEGIGATTVKEISVEEALERCNVVVSQ